MSVLDRLAGALRAEGGLLASAVREPRPGAPAAHGALAATGPRAAGHEAEVELLVEAVREGYEAHYGSPRVLDPADRDLALLAGDHLYALGLERLAALGDLEAIGELADVIALCAQARAAGDPALAEAAWDAGAVAVGAGADAAHDEAKVLAREGRPEAAAALRAAARRPGGGASPAPPPRPVAR